MEDNKDQFVANTVEAKVYELLSQYAGENESVEYNKITDLYFPKGLKKLGWPANTYVEIKYRLVWSSLNIIRHIYDQVAPAKFIVIYFDGGDAVSYIEKNQVLAGRVDFISYIELSRPLKVRTRTKLKLSIDDQRRLIDRARRDFRENRITLFLGAGVSASAGVPAWNTLLEELCIRKGISKFDADVNSIVKGRVVIDKYKEQNKALELTDFYNDMRSVLYQNVRESKLIKSIANWAHKGNVEAIITYNYDNLIEEEINKEQNKCQSIFDKTRTSQMPVYHVHGYIAKEEGQSPIVLGEQEYHDIYAESYNWGSVEQLHALCRTSCFFIGLSMSDPNLRRLLDISNKGGEIESSHYVFLRRVDYNIPFMEKIMGGFGVSCIWYDRHEDLPKLLDEIVGLPIRRSVIAK